MAIGFYPTAIGTELSIPLHITDKGSLISHLRMMADALENSKITHIREVLMKMDSTHRVPILAFDTNYRE